MSSLVKYIAVISAERWKKRTITSKWIDLVEVMVRAALEELKDQVRDRSARKNIWLLKIKNDLMAHNYQKPCLDIMNPEYLLVRNLDNFSTPSLAVSYPSEVRVKTDMN